MVEASTSQQVNWFDTVYQFVAPWLQAAGMYPAAGTPAWAALPDDDPAKWAALLDAAQHWVLRVETCQTALAEASRAVAAALDWGAVAVDIRDHQDFYAAKPWMKRIPS